MLPFYCEDVKKYMTRIVREVKSDIIHAHNIFSTPMVKEISNYPLVYDNQGYWSMYTKTQLESYYEQKKQGLEDQ